MRIDVDIDDTQLLLRLRNGQKRLAFAAVNAINNTAKRIQAVERQRVETEFEVRRTEFIRREAAIIKPFASVSQARPFAEIAVGQKPRLLLSQFERGGERRPVTPGAKKVAEPVIGGPARPVFSGPVTPELLLRRLRFDRTKTGRRRVGIVRTATYLIKDVGIFQRIGRVTKAAYLFTRGKRIEARLRFVPTAERVANQWFKEEMEREVIKAIQFARGQGL